MMYSQRNFLIIALLFVSLMIWQTWKQDKYLQPLQQATEMNTIADHTIPVSSQGKRIKVKTDVLDLTINTLGGNVEQALLLTYPKKLKSKDPFQLLETGSDFIYQAQSGLIGCNGPNDIDYHLYPLYNVNQDTFSLAADKNELIIPMIWIDTAGNTFTKTFTLKRSEYAVNVNYSIKNFGTKPLIVCAIGQLKQSIKLPSYRNTDGKKFALQSFRGAAYSTSEKKYEKYKFENIANNENLNIKAKGGWIAMLQQYFATAWIPRSDGTNNFYTANLGNKIAAIGYKSQPILIQPGKTGHLGSTLWIGPAIQDKMAEVAPNLDLVVDYGWLWFISQPLFKLLKFIHSFLGNWGFSIIVITFIVRGIMYPLTKAQYTSMAKMRILQPKIQAIRNISDDKQRQSQQMIALYKAEKVNPLGGCLPLLIQMPIFLALYYMLMGSVELRHAPFALWIHDLSAQDPYYIFPIMMGATMFLIQRMSPTTVNDPIQKKIMTIVPIIFTIFFFWFPSGLVLYYIVSNLVTVIQQQLIYHSLEKRGLHPRKKKSFN